MQTGTQRVVTRVGGMVWSGRVRSGLLTAFLLWDGWMKVVKHPLALKGMTDAGYPQSSIVPIGIALVLSAVVYAIPQTAVLGAVLLTGYLGGAAPPMCIWATSTGKPGSL